MRTDENVQSHNLMKFLKHFLCNLRNSTLYVVINVLLKLSQLSSLSTEFNNHAKNF